MSRARDSPDGKFANDLTVDTDTLAVDATNDFVGINTTTQAGWTDADDLVISNASGNHAGMTILNTNTSNNSVIAFADGTTGDAAYRGAIEYLHGSDAMRFRTASTERLRILSGGGLTFNGDTAAANALDDYEEGTFTPIVDHNTENSTFTSVNGNYTKIGNTVTVQLRVDGGNTGTSGTTLRIRGLPFTPNVGQANQTIGVWGGNPSQAVGNVHNFNPPQLFKGGSPISDQLTFVTAMLVYQTS